MPRVTLLAGETSITREEPLQIWCNEVIRFMQKWKVVKWLLTESVSNLMLVVLRLPVVLALMTTKVGVNILCSTPALSGFAGSSYLLANRP